MRWALLAAFLAGPAAAAERETLYGTWGTQAQCARAPLKPGGTVAAEPFLITSDWLRQGQIYCRLTWFPVEPRADGFFTGAHAQCGEDAVRNYFLRMVLKGEELFLHWDFPLSNGPLARCAAP